MIDKLLFISLHFISQLKCSFDASVQVILPLCPELLCFLACNLPKLPLPNLPNLLNFLNLLNFPNTETPKRD